MPNAPHQSFQPLDPGRVNTMDPVELRYWCDQLHCGEDELKDIVDRVGEHVAAVRQALEERRGQR
ncbi:DUF3606 domain-containing protein [Azohydromonas caseinilytica]|uniref:DUF3606 domain-containing protein n=1 Tax=Azohydromonas caseinilytica TaxID=2728836 RepID=A0A848F8K4_9BURK|nr:DUF3606 domain-containing protein [Azohydromonas caseinilytica]NML14580.1 DUF3606 domain-containing protein [Azohydromonas caseinilytica]